MPGGVVPTVPPSTSLTRYCSVASWVAALLNMKFKPYAKSYFIPSRVDELLVLAVQAAVETLVFHADGNVGSAAVGSRISNTLGVFAFGSSPLVMQEEF